MDAVTKLREILPEVDPALITAEDRLALLDLIAGSFAAGGGGLRQPSTDRRRSSSISSKVS